MIFKKNIVVSALGALLFMACSLQAGVKKYTFNANHSAVGFRVKHWQVITKTGYFEEFEGLIRYDEKKTGSSSVEVQIEAASIDSNNELRDKHLRGPDFFDVAKYPQLSFKSTRVTTGKEPGTLHIDGKLSLCGVTRPVLLTARILGKLVDDESGKERLAFEASAWINRKDFGLGWNKRNKAGTFMIGDVVEIVINGATVKE